MELTFLDIHAGGEQYREELLRLYEASFPRMERKPVSSLERTCAEGKMRILAICADGAFAGLAILMSDGKARLLDYFAILPEKRNRGIGGMALRALLEQFADLPFIVEIERTDESAEDNEQRLRRRAFYLRNGMESSGAFVWLFQVEYELLCANGSIRYADYRSLLCHCMGNRMKPFLHQIEI